MRRLPAAVSGALLLTLSLAACGGDDSGSDTGQSESSDSASPEAGADESDAGGGDAAGGTTCEYPEDDQPAAKENEPPPTEATVSGEVPATITLAGSEVPITLDADAAPCAVNSFVSLAEQGYFDDTSCHRLTTSGIFVLQCGDPTTEEGFQGTGGPGYSFADELSGDETYERGTLAMANAGPDTNGSQFFMVFDSSPLDPLYTVFGSISDEGLEVVDAIAEAGAEGGAPDGPPVEDATIESVTVD